MEALATLTSKGQITVPKSVRDALGVAEGDQLVFRVEGDHATVSRVEDFLELAGSVEVPAALRNATWDEVITRARLAMAEEATRG